MHKHMQAAKDKPSDEIIGKAAVAAIVIGVLVTIVLVLEAGNDSYSSLYLKPDSYSNYITGKTVSFTYGVQCFETKRTDYDLSVFLNETQVAQKQFSIESKGKSLEDNISFEVPGNTVFPVKVSILLTANGKTYSTHFWLKGWK
jgi:hypothetical protein